VVAQSREDAVLLWSTCRYDTEKSVLVGTFGGYAPQPNSNS